jgi:segregation and condensation protein A
MEQLNIEMASEFILVAATLMRIKAKMLLPRKELDEKGKEIDPREELVNRLLEYKRYKEASEALRKMEDERQSIAKRGNIEQEAKEIAAFFETEYEMQSLTIFKLMKSFQNVLDRVAREKTKVVHTIEQPAYTIEGEKMLLRDLVSSESEVPFEKVFEFVENRVHAVFTFLALLEMIQEQFLTIIICEGYNNFWVRKKTDRERLLSEGVEV